MVGTEGGMVGCMSGAVDRAGVERPRARGGREAGQVGRRANAGLGGRPRVGARARVRASNGGRGLALGRGGPRGPARLSPRSARSAQGGGRGVAAVRGPEGPLWVVVPAVWLGEAARVSRAALRAVWGAALSLRGLVMMRRRDAPARLGCTKGLGGWGSWTGGGLCLPQTAVLGGSRPAGHQSRRGPGVAGRFGLVAWALRGPPMLGALRGPPYSWVGVALLTRPRYTLGVVLVCVGPPLPFGGPWRRMLGLLSRCESACGPLNGALKPGPAWLLQGRRMELRGTPLVLPRAAGLLGPGLWREWAPGWPRVPW